MKTIYYKGRNIFKGITIYDEIYGRRPIKRKKRLVKKNCAYCGAEVERIQPSKIAACIVCKAKRKKKYDEEKRGFALLSRERLRAIASRGGISAHERGTAHTWTQEEAKKAGRKGGKKKKLS